MKVLESQSAALTNFEVLTHLNAVKAKPRTTSQRSQNVETVLKELHDYLAPPPSSPNPIPQPPYSSVHYSPATIRDLMVQLKPFKLMKSEMLMVLNLRPSEIGLLDCVIEECDLRFTEEQQMEILEIVGDVLGRQEDRTNGEDMQVEKTGTGP